jgi:tetratricopeptide (TPR) repeat protein
VPQSKSPSVITLNFKPPALRWVLLVPALIAILGAWSAVRWYVGNTVAEYSPSVDEGGLEMAQMAVRWAPGDPLTHWRLASFEEKTFSAENLAAAVREYELAVQTSPYDYRYWMELGRALEAAGDPDSGEKALRRAVELAPAYSHPRWHYGNLLLRQGKTDEAFTQLSRAAEADEVMLPSIFGLASQVFNGDVDKIVQVLPAPSVRLQFAINLIGTGKLDEAARVLRTISVADRKAQPELTDRVLKSLLEKKQFHAALALMRELEPDQSQLPEPERFWNGGFDKPVPVADPQPFRWVISNRTQAQIAIDPVGRSGAGSLRIIFKAPTKLETIPVAQTIIVEPETQYRLQYYQRTEGLTSASTPVVTISDSVDNLQLIASRPLPTGTNDWQLVTLDFKTKPKHEGVSLGLMRAACEAQEPICPIFGTVWYDDFNLQRVGSSGSSRRTGSSTR